MADFSAFEGFIFDLDGTLVDSFHDIRTAINMVRADHGFGPLDLDFVISCVGYGARELVQRTMGTCSPEMQAQLVTEFRSYYSSHLVDETRLYPGVLEGLDALSDRHLAVLSNKPIDACREILRRLGISDRFEVIYGFGAEFPAKPDPAGLLSIVNDVFHISPLRTLMVGDFTTDVETARNAGVPVAIVRTGMHKMVTVEPDWFINDISELSSKN